MFSIIFYILVSLMFSILFLRVILSVKYFTNIGDNEDVVLDEKKYTIVQPILSGDPRLEKDLRANLENTNEMSFIWLIDKVDLVAQETADKILKEASFKNRVQIIKVGEVPQEINPKIFKLNFALEHIKTEYTIILDDDSVIDKRYLKELAYYEYEGRQRSLRSLSPASARLGADTPIPSKKEEYKYDEVLTSNHKKIIPSNNYCDNKNNKEVVFESECDASASPNASRPLGRGEPYDEKIITGIPYNYGNKNFYSKLLAGFVNSNSFLTYFTMAELEENKSINGMFYIIKTNILKKYNVFEEIKYFLCDDLALASFLLEKNIKIIQTRIFCNVRTTIPNLKKYILQMKRWLLFSNIYMKKNFSLKFFVFILLPTILPIIILISTLFFGKNYFLLVLILFFIKSLLVYFYRYFFLKLNSEIISVFYEFLNDFILPMIFIYTLLSPPVIIWRNKKIRVLDGEIKYE